MPDPRIADIESFRKLLETAEGLQQIKKALPFFKPILRLLGVDVQQMEQALADVDSLSASTRLLVSLPDRFNDLFATRGWIHYEMLNQEMILAVVERGESGDIDGAETQMVEYYNEETLDWNLKFMIAVEAFLPRMPLARKAMADYLDGRYHACVPVVLALLDGTVNDISPVGFFAQGVNLEAWDSMSAHSTGLAVLAKTLGRKRARTTTEALSIPYRHGILHGMDLGYDNKLVAAKAWAALFAIRPIC